VYSLRKFKVHGSVHRNNILVYKSQQDAHVTEFILSDNCSTCFGHHITHLQEHKTTVTTVSGNRYTLLLLSWKTWNRFECAVGGVRHSQHTQTGSNSSTIAADNNTV
jgi:hypothetical protein